MKKFITIAILVSLLMTMLSSALVVSAQEGTPVSTEEPTEEPTQEPTEEPTPESTVEPTEEPTQEPTEEPTVEPTEEPTQEPTEEPTVEPTEEPTQEPTEEPTEEPTTTPTPTLAVGTTGDISAQTNVGGSWTSEYIGIQNLGSGTANIMLDLYQGSSSPAASIARNNIPVEGSVFIRSSDLSNGRYSGSISSDQPMAAAVININATGSVGDGYLGLNTLAISQTLPIVFRDHSLWESRFHIQNTLSSEQTVTVDAYKVGFGTPSASPTYTIPGNSSITVDFMSSDFADFGSGLGAYGYVVVTGSSGPVAVICSNINDYPTAIIEMLYRGFSAAEAAQELIVPVAYNMHSQWESGIMVVNMSSETTNVTMTYYEDSEYYGGGTYQVTKPLGPNQAVDFTLRYTEGLPQPSFGSAKLYSSNANAKILAIANSVTYPETGSTGFSGPALNPDLATTKIAVPVAFNRGLSDLNNLNTGIGVYSVGAGGTITTKWVRADSDPVVSYTAQKTGTANGITTFWAPSLAGVPTDFDGAIYVEAAGPGQRIIALVNLTRYSQGISCQMPGHSY